MALSLASSSTQLHRVVGPRIVRPNHQRSLVPRALVSSTSTSTSTWSEFADKYSGEWEGVTATFSPEGQPVQLDPHYVPGAYRDWGVEVHDWQSTCSSLADGSKPGQVTMMCRRMMPTVGCEADAVAFTEEASQDLAVLAHSPTGSYVAGPIQLKREDKKATIEVCLVVSDASTSGKPTRLRLVQQLQRNWQSGQWTVYKVDVHHERWDSAYRGKVELCGCGGGMPVFAMSTPIAPEQVAGHLPVAEWKQAWTFAPASDGTATQPSSASVLQDVATDAPAVRLPLGLWFRSSVAGAAGDIWLEVGGLMKPDSTADTSAAPWAVSLGTCLYKDGLLQGAAVGMHSTAA